VASVYLSGILTAWSLTQLALGIFFAGAYVILKRERDVAIFSVVCLVLAVHSTSSAYAHLQVDAAQRHLAISGILAAALLAAALNLHFVLAYLGHPRRRGVIIAAYVATACFEVVNLLDLWWVAGSEEVVASRVFGFELLNWHAHPTVFGALGLCLTGIELTAAAVLLWRGWRRGNAEARYALFGCVLVLLSAGNDIALGSSLVTHTIYFVPHTFMVYAFAVTGTLVVRQRRTVSALAQAERELVRATEQLRVSHAELEEVQHELLSKQQLAAVGELAAAIAHEVRNPLAVIVNAVAGLRRRQASQEEHEVLLAIVEEEAQRLNQLVTDLLRFARPTTLKRAPVDVPELVRSACGSMVNDQGLELVVGEDCPTEVQADANLLRLALENVLQNAAQAAPADGKVEVRLCADKDDGGDCIRIEVRDFGSGMSERTLTRALDPFFTTRPSGTGLGLPIVKRVIDAHGGKIALRSVEGEGTTVSLWVPVQGRTASSAPPAPRSVSQDAGGSSGLVA